MPKKALNPYIYTATLVRIIDADTLDCDIDLGFGVWIRKQRVRFRGIDTPESRTRNLEDNKSVCEVLKKEGHAREYFGGKKEPWV